MSIINGRRAANLQPSEFGQDESGGYWITRYQGTRTELQALIPQIILGGGQFTLQESYSGGADTLTARFPYTYGQQTEIPVDDWEFYATETEKDVLESNVAEISALSQTNKEAIREAIQNPGTPPSITDPTALELYYLMLDGVRAHPVESPTLRHTMTVSNQWAIPASTSNVGRIYTTPSLISVELVPNSLLISLPNDLSTRDGVEYGWRKKFPTIRIAALQKIQIQQEWIYGLYSTLLFGLPI